jgi:hypothetical protein
MPTPTELSPNTGNYQVGKGVVSFKKEGDSTYRDLGNVSSLVATPGLTTLDHFSSRSGTKKKDLSVVLEKTMALKMTMDEITAENVAIMLLGSVDEAAVGGPIVEIFATNAVNGALRFVGANDIGAQVQLDLWNVSFQPSGDMSFITDEWNEMEVTADVLVASGGPNDGKFGQIQFLNTTPS